jgi:hypothetical protein
VTTRVADVNELLTVEFNAIETPNLGFGQHEPLTCGGQHCVTLNVILKSFIQKDWLVSCKNQRPSIVIQVYCNIHVPATTGIPTTVRVL